MSDTSLEGLIADLRALGSQAPLVMARSLNRALKAAQTATARAVAADLGAGVRAVAKTVTAEKATRNSQRAAVVVAGARIPLIDLGARGPEPSRGRGHGVSYRLPGGRGRVSDAFIATMRGTSHRGVFKRLGKARLPLVELRGPSVPHVYEKYVPQFQATAHDALVKNLQHEIDWARSQETGEE